MANGIRTGKPHGFNKGHNLKFREGSRVRQTTEEGRRTYRPKRCGNNNKDEDNSPKTLNDKNHQASSQKFRRNNYLCIRCNSVFRKRNPGENVLEFVADKFNIHLSSVQHFLTDENKNFIVCLMFFIIYLPTPPLGQDMTQGQFLSRV